jgi:hypothetical protein
MGCSVPFTPNSSPWCVPLMTHSITIVSPFTQTREKPSLAFLNTSNHSAMFFATPSRPSISLSPATETTASSA